jgi:hypothetical protein
MKTPESGFYSGSHCASAFSEESSSPFSSDSSDDGSSTASAPLNLKRKRRRRRRGRTRHLLREPVDEDEEAQEKDEENSYMGTSSYNKNDTSSTIASARQTFRRTKLEEECWHLRVECEPLLVAAGEVASGEIGEDNHSATATIHENNTRTKDSIRRFLGDKIHNYRHFVPSLPSVSLPPLPSSLSSSSLASWRRGANRQKKAGDFVSRSPKLRSIRAEILRRRDQSSLHLDQSHRGEEGSGIAYVHREGIRFSWWSRGSDVKI